MAPAVLCLPLLPHGAVGQPLVGWHVCVFRTGRPQRHGATLQLHDNSARRARVKMNGLEITRVAAEDGAQHYNAVITVQISKKQLDNELVKSITELENVLTVEEL